MSRLGGEIDGDGCMTFACKDRSKLRDTYTGAFRNGRGRGLPPRRLSREPCSDFGAK
eukprot:gene935-269_t